MERGRNSDGRGTKRDVQVVTLVSDKVEFKIKSINQHKEGHVTTNSQ